MTPGRASGRQRYEDESTLVHFRMRQDEPPFDPTPRRTTDDTTSMIEDIEIERTWSPMSALTATSCNL
jgi:hypothetical protein